MVAPSVRCVVIVCLPVGLAGPSTAPARHRAISAAAWVRVRAAHPEMLA